MAQVRNALYKLVKTRDPEVVDVYKFDRDYVLLEQYVLNVKPTYTICSCPYPGHGGRCRHQKMFDLWNQHQAWTTGAFYNWDKSEWIHPVTPED